MNREQLGFPTEFQSKRFRAWTDSAYQLDTRGSRSPGNVPRASLCEPAIATTTVEERKLRRGGYQVERVNRGGNPFGRRFIFDGYTM